MDRLGHGGAVERIAGSVQRVFPHAPAPAPGPARAVLSAGAVRARPIARDREVETCMATVSLVHPAIADRQLPVGVHGAVAGCSHGFAAARLARFTICD